MYYPDLFEGTNGKTLSPSPDIPDMMTLFQSQETVATIGSMNMEFVDLMMMDHSKTIGSITDDWAPNTPDVEALMSGSVEILSPPPPPSPPPPSHLPTIDNTDSASLLTKAGPNESLSALDYLSDDSSLWEPQHHHRHHHQTNKDCNHNDNDSDKDDKNKNNKSVEKAKPKRCVHKAGKSKRRTSCRRVRRSYDIAESDRTYVRYTDADVLCQRGGLANKHPGNHRYLKAKDALQDSYRATVKSERTVVAQQLVEYVHGWGGRFLRYDTNARSWYEIHEHTARTKAGQALREEYTPEDRKIKRKRYQSKQSS